ncbi:hypothetical protein TSAR_004279 [Trichomalopsis sarcophagae]|uniref:Uncharacterized protein n=1 Tax=Trichomalopsis sarcophagae TaxID=543379 RepID=A0A232FEN0_9HYME|nr:hypothetical protein TSAR_004279 [Trichomalopsis sarcophagae]
MKLTQVAFITQKTQFNYYHRLTQTASVMVGHGLRICATLSACLLPVSRTETTILTILLSNTTRIHVIRLQISQAFFFCPLLRF